MEITLYLEDYTQIDKIMLSIHNIVVGHYNIVVDFWLFAGSATKTGLELRYPSNVLTIFLFCDKSDNQTCINS